MRADARRNYDALVAAADEMFTAHGPDASLDEIARRAGVGNATLYRHFPGRRHLLVAVCVGEVKALCVVGEALQADPDAGQALSN
jgi:AcrR family transcriptional regulator